MNTPNPQVLELLRRRRLWLHWQRSDKVDEIDAELRLLGVNTPAPVERRPA